MHVLVFPYMYLGNFHFQSQFTHPPKLSLNVSGHRQLYILGVSTCIKKLLSQTDRTCIIQKKMICTVIVNKHL